MGDRGSSLRGVAVILSLPSPWISSRAHPTENPYTSYSRQLQYQVKFHTTPAWLTQLLLKVLRLPLPRDRIHDSLHTIVPIE